MDTQWSAYASVVLNFPELLQLILIPKAVTNLKQYINFGRFVQLFFMIISNSFHFLYFY